MDSQNPVQNQPPAAGGPPGAGGVGGVQTPQVHHMNPTSPVRTRMDLSMNMLVGGSPTSTNTTSAGGLATDSRTASPDAHRYYQHPTLSPPLPLPHPQVQQQPPNSNLYGYSTSLPHPQNEFRQHQSPVLAPADYRAPYTLPAMNPQYQQSQSYYSPPQPGPTLPQISPQPQPLPQHQLSPIHSSTALPPPSIGAAKPSQPQPQPQLPPTPQQLQPRQPPSQPAPAAAAASPSPLPVNQIPPGGAPARRYLNDNVTPVLLEGMKMLAREQPKDPLLALAHFLEEKHNELEQAKVKVEGSG